MGTESHISVYEQGGVSTLGGVHPRTVPNNSDGTMDLSKLEAAIRYELDDHYPITRLICLENTQARYVSVIFVTVINAATSQTIINLLPNHSGSMRTSRIDDQHM